ncbi:MAG TPA: hypothetical protein VGC15_20245 [Acetobacteraceae bacterium]
MLTPANHLYRPSVARVLVLDGTVPVPRGVRPGPRPSWPAKDPADVLDYQFDISPALSGCHGDAVATLDVSITPADPGGVSLVSAAADGARAVLWLGGGQAGVTYAVTLTIGTQAGRTLSRAVLLPVQALSGGTSVSGVLQTETGAPVQDSAGNTITVGG